VCVYVEQVGRVREIPSTCLTLPSGINSYVSHSCTDGNISTLSIAATAYHKRRGKCRATARHFAKAGSQHIVRCLSIRLCAGAKTARCSVIAKGWTYSRRWMAQAKKFNRLKCSAGGKKAKVKPTASRGLWGDWRWALIRRSVARARWGRSRFWGSRDAPREAFVSGW